MNRAKGVRGSALTAAGTLVCFTASLLTPYRAAAQSAPSDDVTASTPISDGTGGAPTLSQPATNVPDAQKSALNTLSANAQITVDGSTGAAHGTFAFQLPHARGEAQPELALTYNSSVQAVGLAGVGWTLQTPSIVRRGAAGMPLFTDDVFTASSSDLAASTATFDEYLADGQLLVPICIVGSCGGQILPGEVMPTSLAGTTVGGWMYFRREVDDGARYFFAPSGQTWLKQTKSGEVIQFGHPLDSASVDPSLSDGIERPATTTNFASSVTPATAVYRWDIVRDADASGNTVYFTWTNNTSLAPGIQLPQLQYLSEIYDTLGVGKAVTPGAFAHHVHLTWQPSFPIPQPDPITTPQIATPIWKAVPFVQLASVDVTSASWSSPARALVRRYDLAYHVNSYGTQNRLSTITLEGECPAPGAGGGLSPVSEGANGMVPNPTSCAASTSRQLVQLGYYPDTLGGSAPSLSPVVPLFPQAPNTPSDQATKAQTATILDLNGDGAGDLVVGSGFFTAQPFSGEPTTISPPSDPSYTPCSLSPSYAILSSTTAPATDAGAGDAGDGGAPSFSGQAGCGVGGNGNGVLASLNPLTLGGISAGSGGGAGAEVAVGPVADQPSVYYHAQYPAMFGDWLTNGSANWLTESATGTWQAYTAMNGSIAGFPVAAAACQTDHLCDRGRAVDIDGDGLVDQLGAFENSYFTQRTHGGTIAPFALSPPAWPGWATIDFTNYATANPGWRLSDEENGMGQQCTYNPPAQPYCPPGPSQFFRSIADMNGDGLADTVLGLVDAYGTVKLTTWLNQGDGTLGAPSLAFNTPLPSRTDGPCFSFMPYPNAFYFSCNLNQAVVRMADVNNDGLADMLELTDNYLGVCLRNSPALSQPTFNCITTPLPLPPLTNPAYPTCDVFALDPGVSSINVADVDGTGVPRIVFSRYTEAAYDNSQTPPTVIFPACWDSPYQGTGVLPGTSPSLGAAPAQAYPGFLQSMSLFGGATQNVTYQPVRSIPGPTVPVSAWVVSSLQSTNGLPSSAQQAVTSTVNYNYTNPLYDPRDKQFVGFQTVTQTTTGAVGAPGQARTTTFATAACGPSTGTSCTDQVDYGWFRAIRGLPLGVNVSDASGNELQTNVSSYSEHRPYVGLDGRVVRRLPFYKQTTYDWDPAAQTPSALQLQSFVNLGGSPYEAYSLGVVNTIQIPATGSVHVQQRDEDDLGNLLDTIDFGQPGVDVPIRTESHWSLPSGDTTGWSYRVATRSLGYADPSGATLQNPPARSYGYSYTARGQLFTQTASLPNEPAPMGLPNFAAGSPPDATVGSQVCVVGCASGNITGIQYDGYGNAITVPRANNRCTATVYDALFAQLPQTTLAYASGCGSTSPAPMQTVVVYDRGLEKVTEATAPFSGVVPHITLKQYDSFGRVVQVDQPMAQMAGVVDTGTPALLVSYNDASVPRQITSSTVDGASTSPVYNLHYQFIDGWGDTLSTFDQLGSGTWSVNGLHTRYPSGPISRAWPPFVAAGSPPSFSLSPLAAAVGAVTPPAISTYDGEGRALTRTDSNGFPTTYTYHFGAGVPSAPGISGAAASVTVQDPEQNPPPNAPPGPHHVNSFTISFSDGHGRVTQTDQHSNSTASGGGDLVTVTSLAASGEPLTITQSFPGGLYSRSMSYDGVGHRVSQTEPNVGTSTYAYNDSGDLVGTMDARGCGEVFYHDGLGRLTAEDYSPCPSSQAPPYSAPNLRTGDGTEAFYSYDGYGNLTTLSDRGQRSTFKYDGRSRPTWVFRQIATPTGGAALASRYAPQSFSKAFTAYSESNKVLQSTTGTDLAAFDVAGQVPQIYASYAPLGPLSSVSSSFAFLFSQSTDAAGRVTQRGYGDVANTEAAMNYDFDGALINYTLTRAKGPWGRYSQGGVPALFDGTIEGVLTSLTVTRDMIGNPIAMTQNVQPGGIDPNQWQAGAAPTSSRSLSYGDDYRLQEVQTQYTGSLEGVAPDDRFVSPYVPFDRDLYPAPASVSTGNRVRDQTYTYNLRGDVELSTDDANVFWDRSLGNVSSVGDQLASAGTTTGYGTLATAYDAAGNLQTVAIQNGSTYNYAFDELGRLASATRADPDGVQILEQYAYDANGQRVRSTAENSATGATTHTVQIFDSLVLKNVAFPDSGGNYEHDTSTEQLYLNANGQSFGRAFIAQGPMPLGIFGTVHVFMPMRDPLGSTSFVIDHDTGELVEAATYQPYGAVDSDYRPSRWDSPREDIRYSGHWDDAEVGLSYFGARYYSPNLMHFITPDPLSIHAGKGDLNPYEYANGSPMRFVDPTGLDDNDSSYIFSTIDAQQADVLTAAYNQFKSSVNDGLSQSAAAQSTLQPAGPPGGPANDLNNSIVKATPGGASSLLFGAVGGLGEGAGVASVGESLSSLTAADIEGAGAAPVADAFPSVATPYGQAVQDLTEEALGAREAVENGATLFKGGRLGTSAGPESQFFSLENPLSPGFAQRYGIPANNAAFDFVETATLRPGSPFIVRAAPGVEANGGGALEIVLDPGSAWLTGFSMP